MKNKNEKTNFLYALCVGSILGFYIAISLIFFLLFGLWLDKKFGVFPLFFLLGMILGIISIFFELNKLLHFFSKKVIDRK